VEPKQKLKTGDEYTTIFLTTEDPLQYKRRQVAHYMHPNRILTVHCTCTTPEKLNHHGELCDEGFIIQIHMLLKDLTPRSYTFNKSTTF
jgi:hypothetical protein